jgi:hypothetical protein
LSAVLNGNLDDLITSKISTDRGILAASTDNVGFVGL